MASRIKKVNRLEPKFANRVSEHKLIAAIISVVQEKMYPPEVFYARIKENNIFKVLLIKMKINDVQHTNTSMKAAINYRIADSNFIYKLKEAIKGNLGENYFADTESPGKNEQIVEEQASKVEENVIEKEIKDFNKECTKSVDSEQNDEKHLESQWESDDEPLSKLKPLTNLCPQNAHDQAVSKIREMFNINESYEYCKIFDEVKDLNFDSSKPQIRKVIQNLSDSVSNCLLIIDQIRLNKGSSKSPKNIRCYGYCKYKANENNKTNEPSQKSKCHDVAKLSHRRYTLLVFNFEECHPSVAIFSQTPEVAKHVEPLIFRELRNEERTRIKSILENKSAKRVMLEQVDDVDLEKADLGNTTGLVSLNVLSKARSEINKDFCNDNCPLSEIRELLHDKKYGQFVQRVITKKFYPSQKLGSHEETAVILRHNYNVKDIQEIGQFSNQIRVDATSGLVQDLKCSKKDHEVDTHNHHRVFNFFLMMQKGNEGICLSEFVSSMSRSKEIIEWLDEFKEYAIDHKKVLPSAGLLFITDQSFALINAILKVFMNGKTLTQYSNEIYLGIEIEGNRIALCVSHFTHTVTRTLKKRIKVYDKFPSKRSAIYSFIMEVFSIMIRATTFEDVEKACELAFEILLEPQELNESKNALKKLYELVPEQSKSPPEEIDFKENTEEISVEATEDSEAQVEIKKVKGTLKSESLILQKVSNSYDRIEKKKQCDSTYTSQSSNELFDPEGVGKSIIFDYIIFAPIFSVSGYGKLSNNNRVSNAPIEILNKEYKTDYFEDKKNLIRYVKEKYEIDERKIKLCGKSKILSALKGRFQEKKTLKPKIDDDSEVKPILGKTESEVNEDLEPNENCREMYGKKDGKPKKPPRHTYFNLHYLKKTIKKSEICLPDNKIDLTLTQELPHDFIQDFIRLYPKCKLILKQNNNIQVLDVIKNGLVENNNYYNPLEKIIQYKKITASFNDLNSLEGNAWLKDNIFDICIRIFVDTLIDDNTINVDYILCTANSCLLDNKRKIPNYIIRKFNDEALDILLMPLVQGGHFRLLILNQRKKKLMLYDPLPEMYKAFSNQFVPLILEKINSISITHFTDIDQLDGETQNDSFNCGIHVIVTAFNYIQQERGTPHKKLIDPDPNFVRNSAKSLILSLSEPLHGSCQVCRKEVEKKKANNCCTCNSATCNCCSKELKKQNIDTSLFCVRCINYFQSKL